MPYLVCTHNERGTRWTVDVDEDPFLIGRSRSAHVCLRDVSVSKAHVKVERSGTRYHFRDLGSRNGTYINELRLDRGPLEDGDDLRIGKITISFYKDRESAPPGADNPPIAGDDALKEASLAGTTSLRGGGGPAPETEGVDVEDDDLTEETLRMLLGTPGKGASSRPTTTPAEKGEGEAESARASRRSGTATEPAPPPQGGRTEVGPAKRPGQSTWRMRAPPPPSPSPPQVSRGVLVVACVSCLIAGFLLGSWLGGGREADEPLAGRDAPRPGTEGALEGGKAEEESELATGPGSRAGRVRRPPALSERRIMDPRADMPALDEASRRPRSESDAAEAAFGERADLEDPETSRRALYRLSLDFLERTPTRREASRWLPMTHEERFKELRAMGTVTFGDSPSGVVRTFLGRAIRPAEARTLSSESPEELARKLAGSSLYASEDHVRRRSARQQAHSLWIDVLDEVPEPRNIDTVLRALEEDRGDASQVVRALLLNGDPAIGPGDLGQDGDEWVREVYARFLLRFPTPEEKEEALAALRREEDGWQWVILEIALREEYAWY